MIIKIRIGNWRFTFTIAPVTDIIGVHSKLPDGNHILMWDFDNTTLNQVVGALQTVQATYNLPNIYILETKKNTNYIAYCFKRLPWRKVVEIIAYTKGVDWGFLKYGIYREKFTLRVTPKCGRKPKLVYILKNTLTEDATVLDLKNWVKYETIQDGYKTKMRKIEINNCFEIAANFIHQIDSYWRHKNGTKNT